MARYDNEGPRRDTPQERPNKERETSEHGGGMTSRQPGHGPACGTLVPRREWFPKYGPADGKRVTRYRHDGYGHEPEPERGRRKLTDGCGVGAVPRSPLPEGARSLTVFQPERIMYSHPGWTAPAPGIIRLQEALTAAGVRWWEDRKRDVTVAADLSADRAAELCGQHAVPSFMHIAFGDGNDSFHAQHLRADRNGRMRKVREKRILGINPEEVLEKAESELGMKIPPMPEENRPEDGSVEM